MVTLSRSKRFIPIVSATWDFISSLFKRKSLSRDGGILGAISKSLSFIDEASELDESDLDDLIDQYKYHKRIRVGYTLYFDVDEF